jgi:regulation of enolase protein 1 (concanavalin A-like superfamily)
VRNAFGRPLGTVSEVLADAGRNTAHALPAIPDPPARRAPAPRSSAPLIIAIAAVLIVAGLIAASVLGASPPPPPAEPVPPAPVARPEVVPARPAPSQPAPSKPAPSKPEADALPDGLAYLDLGDARPKGRVSHKAGAYVIEGGGEDLWGRSDESAFVHRQAEGDLTLTVRVTDIADTSDWEKSGIMLRRELNGPSAMAGLIVTSEGRMQFLRRETNASEMACDSGPDQRPPVWLRLTRRGSELSAAWSSDGQAWNTVGETRRIDALAGRVHAGLAVSSHNRSVTNRTCFDRFSIASP